MFTSTDPLGRKVSLTTKTWNIHIMPQHTELYKQERLVQRTIEDPEIILKHEKIENRENYYRLCSLPGVNCASILKVIVEHSTDTSDIITAYAITSTNTQALNKRGVVYERP